MKQVELAKKLGISKSYLSMILKGQRVPNPELAAQLCSLGVVNFEANLSLRGRCPKPLDECASYSEAVNSSQLHLNEILSQLVYKGQIIEVSKAIIDYLMTEKVKLRLL